MASALLDADLQCRGGCNTIQQMGMASALIATLRSIGQTTGQAVSGTIFAVERELRGASLAVGFDGSECVSLSLILAFQSTVLMLGIIPVVGLLLALFFCLPQTPSQ